MLSTAGASDVSATGAGLAAGFSAAFSDVFREVARLGLRNNPPSLDDFFPSPSVFSDSEARSDFRSFLEARLLKKDERRLGLVASGVVADSATGAVGSVVAAVVSLGTAVGSEVTDVSVSVDFTGSSS